MSKHHCHNGASCVINRKNTSDVWPNRPTSLDSIEPLDAMTSHPVMAHVVLNHVRSRVTDKHALSSINPGGCPSRHLAQNSAR